MTLFKHVVLDIKAHYCRLNIVDHSNEYQGFLKNHHLHNRLFQQLQVRKEFVIYQNLLRLIVMG
jgi:hypothetical protein